jgi:putative transcriptional regulator
MTRPFPAALRLALLLGLAHCLAAQPAPGKLLVAARGLSDPNFERTVVLLVEHGEGGSWGLVLNRPTGVPLKKLFAGEPLLESREGSLFVGGPVGPGRFLLLLRADRPPDKSQRVFADVYLGWSPEALRDARGLSDCRVYSGYAGWAPGQLDAEIGRGDWRLLPAEVPLVFEQRPEQVWEQLARRTETPVAAGGSRRWWEPAVAAGGGRRR